MPGSRAGASGGEETLVNRRSIQKLGAFGGPNLSVESGPRGRLFVGYGSLVHALDIGDSSLPRIVSSFWTSGKVWGLHYGDDLLYVANLRNGLLVVDASTSTLRLRGHLDTPGVLRDVFALGSLAFVADGEAGLGIIDVSNPALPRELSRHNCNNHPARAVFARDHLVYVATTGPTELLHGRLCIIDVADPKAPRLRSITPADPKREGGAPNQWYSNVATDVFVAGDLAYLATGGSGVVVINVSSPDAPKVVSNWTPSSESTGVNAVGLYLQDQRVYVTSNGRLGGLEARGSLFVLDSSQSPKLEQLGRAWSAADDTYGVRVKGQRSYIAHDDAGLREVNLDTLAPSPRSFMPSSVIYDVAATSTHAYVADYFTGLSIVDVSNIGRPSLAGSWYRPNYDVVRPTGQTPRVKVASGTAFLTRNGEGLYVIDVRNPSAPNLLDAKPTTGEMTNVAIDARNLYALESRPKEGSADSQRLLRIFDREDLNAPSRDVELTNEPPRAISVGPSVAYVIAGADFLVIDTSIPSTPRVVRSVNLSTGIALGLSISGETAAVAGNNGYVCLVDLRNIRDPQPSVPVRNLAICAPAPALCVLLRGSRLFVGCEKGGLKVFELNHHADPELVAFYEIHDEPVMGLAIRPRRGAKYSDLFVAAGDMGLWVLRCSAR